MYLLCTCVVLAVYSVSVMDRQVCSDSIVVLVAMSCVIVSGASRVVVLDSESHRQRKQSKRVAM